MLELFALTHVPFEGPAAIGRWAERRGVRLRQVPVYQGGQVMPRAAEIEAMLVMGGPMGVHDLALHPWLAEEKRLIRAVVDRGVPVLGICLGAQLLAEILGGEVRDGIHPEIGWFPVDFSSAARATPWFGGFPARLEVMHWHGDQIEPPPTAISVGSSAACRCQGFLMPGMPVIGLQFHMEWDRLQAEALIRNCADELEGSHPYVQSAVQIMRPEAAFLDMNRRLEPILDRLFVGDQASVGIAP